MEEEEDRANAFACAREDQRVNREMSHEYLRDRKRAKQPPPPPARARNSRQLRDREIIPGPSASSRDFPCARPLPRRQSLTQGDDEALRPIPLRRTKPQFSYLQCKEKGGAASATNCHLRRNTRTHANTPPKEEGRIDGISNAHVNHRNATKVRTKGEQDHNSEYSWHPPSAETLCSREMLFQHFMRVKEVGREGGGSGPKRVRGRC